MSTISIDQVYKELKPLFGLNEDDDRYKIYINALHRLFISDKYDLIKSNNIYLYLFTEYDEFLNKYFEDSPKSAADSHNLMYTNEWNTFLHDVMYNIYKKNAQNKKETILLVKKYSIQTTQKNQDRFIQELIKEHIYIYDDDKSTNDITNNVTRWNKTDVYCDSNNLKNIETININDSKLVPKNSTDRITKLQTDETAKYNAMVVTLDDDIATNDAAIIVEDDIIRLYNAATPGVGAFTTDKADYDKAIKAKSLLEYQRQQKYSEKKKAQDYLAQLAIQHIDYTKSSFSITIHKNESKIYNYIFYFLNIIYTPIIALSSTKHFSYNLNKYVLKKLLLSDQESISSASSFFDVEDVKDVESDMTFLRDDTGLYTIDKNTHEKDYLDTKDSKKFKDLISSNNCKIAKVKDDGLLKCSDYLTKCIINGSNEDISRCKDFMVNPNFWEDIKDEVKNMLPAIMTKTLDAFKFKKITKDGISHYENISEWIKNLSESKTKYNITDVELDQILKNNKLISYLTLLVNTVNSNPAILNKDNRYPKSNNYIDNNIDTMSHTRFSKYGLGLRTVITPFNVDYPSMSRYIDSIKNSASRVNNILGNIFKYDSTGGLVVRGYPFMFFGQMGGSNTSTYQYNNTPNYNDKPYRMSPHIEKLFDILRKVLESNNQSLTREDLDQVNKYIKTYKDSEIQLFKVLEYTDKYIDLVHVYKNHDKNKVLKLEHIQSFVDKHGHLLNKTNDKQTTLFGIFESMLQNAVDKAIDKIKK